MPGAIIVADQPSGAGSGSAGIARNDLWLSQAVNLSIGAGGNTTYLWELLRRPAGSAVTLSTPMASTASFTPDVVGTYRIRLTTNGGGPGNVQTRVYRVRYSNTGVLANRGWAYPAPDERGEEANYGANDRGWSEAFESILEDVRQNLSSVTLSNSTPAPIGAAAAGNGTAASRDNHVHAHGDQASSGTMHAVAVASGNAGFMSGADKAKLDGVASGATNTPLSNAAPAAVGTAAPGADGSASRSDHVHAHGNQASNGSFHAVAIAGGAAGFMSGADKTKLDELAVELVYVTVSGTSKTLALADRQTVQQCTNGSPVTITWPGATFNNGTTIAIDQDGAGQVTVAGSGGITPSSRGNELKTAGQLARIFVDQKTGTAVRVTGDKST